MLNYCMLVGRVGQNPEIRVSQSGKKVCRLSLATNSFYNGKTVTEWHTIVLFDGMAEDKTAECASVKALIEICWNQIFYRCSTINRRHYHRIKRNLRIKKYHSDRIWRPQTGNH